MEDYEAKSAARPSLIITCVSKVYFYSLYLRPGTLSGYLVGYLG